MKTLPLSKFSIFMIAIVIFAISWYAVIVYNSPSATSHQNERIFLLDPYDKSQERYATIYNMNPNSAGFFMYPPSYTSNPENSYQRFLLIRLPEWLGGDKDNVSAFRAYSALDLTSHCVVKYWPQNGRQRIEDPCSGSMYRSLDGYLLTIGNRILLNGNNALPQLDLVSDNEGYLYVKPPKFTDEENGAIGIGRKLSQEEINNSTIFINQHPSLSQEYYFRAPPKFTNGFEALTITGDEYAEKIIYAKQGFRNDNMTLLLKYCDCTKFQPWLEQLTQYSQLWKVGDYFILATPNSVGYNKYSDYEFVFYKDNYKVTFLTGRQFEEGMKLTLDNFFNGTSISEIQKISMGLH